ncbi:MAG: methyltransferase domain-containing protein [Casimicrobiaceae bacterium]|nr:methyltransferase domain-containing protein [Casimicrobiaceae bacterium]MDW8311758.1 methyltransferase domain-containing protein [Burkholderiales bacterium]
MSTEPTYAPIDARAIERAYARSARDYAAAAALEREIGRRQLERFDYIRIEPQWILDLGCGPGTHTAALAARFPAARLIALDRSWAMLEPLVARLRAPTSGWRERLAQWLGRRPAEASNAVAPTAVWPVCADFDALPFRPASVDLLWSNWALHCSRDLPTLFNALAAVLRPGGLLMATLPGTDTLLELRRALAAAGLAPRVHDFPDLHDVGDWLLRSGFVDPVVDAERLALEYRSAAALWRDARSLGAMSARLDRPRGLMTPRARARLDAALETQRASDGVLRITVEVLYLHAWKGAPRRTAEGHAVVPLSAIGRRPAGRTR